MSPYLTWIIVFLVLPLMLLWALFYKRLVKYLHLYFYIVVIGSAYGLAIDYFAAWQDIWYWPANCCTFYRMRGGVPLEEAIFMVLATLLAATLAIITRDWIRGRRA